MKRTFALLVAVAFVGAERSLAGLTFESKRATHKAAPTETSFEATFAFTNSGKHPIVIHKVDSNCGCISAEADKERYAPKESGKVTAIFKIGSAEGLQTKTVSVVYSEEKPGAKSQPEPEVVKPKVIEPAQSPSGKRLKLDPKNLKVPAGLNAPAKLPRRSELTTERLTVELHVPSIIEIEPKITKWPVGSPADSKTVSVVVKHDDPIGIRSVRSSRDNVKVEVKEIEAGRRYELEITPEATDKVQLGMLTIETDSKIPKHQKKLAFFSIHRKAPARQTLKDVLDAGIPPKPAAGNKAKVAPGAKPKPSGNAGT